MELVDWDTGARRRLAGALGRGEPVWLRPARRPPSWVEAQLVALFAGVLGPHAAGLRGCAPDRSPPVPPVPVTVVVPCHQGPPAGLGALLAQDHPVEVLVVANGGGPRRVPGARVVALPWAGHGPTRQRALDHVRTELVLFLSDDARPLGRGWLGTLVAALLGGGWDAVVARQVAWPDAPAAVRARVAAWTPLGDGTLPFPQADHVATLHRTALLRRHPLPPVEIAEDLIWSPGRRVGLVGAAPVLHSHPPRFWPAFTRARAEHAVRAAHGQPVPGAAPGALLRGLLGLPRRVWAEGLPTAAAGAGELLGQWAGPRR